MKPSHKMRDHNFKSPGICIMCLDASIPCADLTQEHIIPKALGGTLRFDRSVCKPCAQHGNQTFEQPALANDFLIPRLLLEITKNSTRTLPKVSLGKWPTFEAPDDLLQFVELALYPKRMVLRHFDPPGILAGIDRPPELFGMRIYIADLSRYFDKEMVNFANMTTHETHTNGPLERSIAKAAYFYAVAVMGIKSFDGQAIRDMIKGKRADTRNFVGSPIQKEPQRANDLHQLSLRIRPGGLLTVIVHLFSSYSVPPYEVVVGKISKN